MTARIQWLLGSLALAFAALIVWLMLAETPAAQRATRPAICEFSELCDTAAPPPVDLRRVPLARNDPDRFLIAQAAAGGTVETYVPTASLLQPSRLFLVQDSALVIVRDMPAGRRALVIRREAGLGRLTVRTDADISLARFALLDPTSGSGDTFLLQQARGSPAFSYRVLAPDSREIREEWTASLRSTCGRGPLTAVPAQWRRDYEAACRVEEARK